MEDELLCQFTVNLSTDFPVRGSLLQAPVEREINTSTGQSYKLDIWPKLALMGMVTTWTCVTKPPAAALRTIITLLLASSVKVPFNCQDTTVDAVSVTPLAPIELGAVFGRRLNATGVTDLVYSSGIMVSVFKQPNLQPTPQMWRK